MPVELFDVNVLVDRARATNHVVRRVFRKGLHGGPCRAFAITVRVAGIERTIMVEDCENVRRIIQTNQIEVNERPVPYILVTSNLSITSSR